MSAEVSICDGFATSRRRAPLNHAPFAADAVTLSSPVSDTEPCPPGSGAATVYPGRMDLALLERTLADHGQPAYRAGQAWQWAAGGAAGYDAMTTLPRALR